MTNKDNKPVNQDLYEKYTASPQHRKLMNDFKDQLLIVLINRLGGQIEIPVKEIDDTGRFILMASVNFTKGEESFYFEIREKELKGENQP